MPVLLETLDQKIAETLADWSLSTTLITIAIALFLAYPILNPSEPDTHPLLLARQSTAAPIRNRNESAIYRSPEIPHGYPLKTGLNVKADGAPRWQSGKDGDLRDVWRELCKGGKIVKDAGGQGKQVPKGAIMSVFGKEEVVEHEYDQMSREINVLGKHLKDAGVSRVAIYMPNSLEYLLAIFACAFYGLSPILLPFNQPHPKAYEQLNLSSADALICEAGTLPLDDIAKQCKNLKSLTWVVEKTSRHMDWAGSPSSKLNVNVWHDLVEEDKSASAELPANQEGEKLGSVIVVSQPSSASAKPTLTTFTHANLISATAAALTSLPLRQRLTPSDLLLPATEFAKTYTLTWTLAALFSHASVALTSVAGPGVDFHAATRSVSPTIIIASPETMANLHKGQTAGLNAGPLIHKLGRANQQSTLASGRMPTPGLLFSLIAPPAAAAQNKPGALRLILTPHQLGLDSPPLSSAMLSDLRIFTRARVVYALTAPEVAGAVAQSHVFDYRVDRRGEKQAMFGAPVASVEVKLLSKNDEQVGKSEPRGELVVGGPAVAGDGEEWRSVVQCEIGEDGCLRLV